MDDTTELSTDGELTWAGVKDTPEAKGMYRVCWAIQILGVLPMVLSGLCVVWFVFNLFTGGSLVVPVAVIVLLTVFMAIVVGINGALKKFSPLYALTFEHIDD